MRRKKVHLIKVQKPRVRKTWGRHPGERVVDNKKRPGNREIEKEALNEYEDTK